MRKLFSTLLLTLVTTNAFALSTQIKELLAAVAMPLAVAAVSNVAGVQQPQLSNLVSTLNQANVPPTQFVDVMRYTPVALTDANGQPFVTYVQTQASQGLTGDALVTAMLQQLRTQYNVTPQPATYFVADNYIPQSYVTPFDTGQFDNNAMYPTDALDVVSLPLAVAAVADIAGVPQDQLASLITTLNQANMPPAQIIEVVRYVPVALVDNGQTFVQYVQQQTAQGITGPALYPVVVRQLQPYYPSTQISVIPPPAPPPQPVVVARTAVRQEHLRRRPIVVDQNFFPPVVVSRAEEVRQHPHGGPPGQLKKQLGLQTGAQVVHAQQPVVVAPRVEEKGHGKGKGHGQEGQRQVVVAQPPPAAVAVPQVAVPQAAVPQGHGNGKGPEGAGPPGQNKDKEHGKGKGKD